VRTVSLEALLWALYDVEPTPAGCVPGPGQADSYERLILLVIADQADRTGSGAMVTKTFIAQVTGFDQSTVKRRLRKLLDRGLLCRGDSRMAAHLPPQYRPNVYDLPHVQERVRPRPKRSRGGSQPPLEGAQLGPPSRGGSGGAQGGLRGGSAETPTPPTPLAPPSPVRAGGLLPPAGAHSARVDGRAQMRRVRDELRARRAANR
jgi:hypothetical protein